MLDHITLLNRVSLGKLAEAMLYYRKVTVFITPNLINGLCRDMGPDRLVAFLDEHRQRVQLRYINWSVGSLELNVEPKHIIFKLGDEASFCVDEPFLRSLLVSGRLPTNSGYIEDHLLSSQLLDLVLTDRIPDDLFDAFFSCYLAESRLPAFLESWILERTPVSPLATLWQKGGLRFELERGAFSGFSITYKADLEIPHSLWVELNHIVSTYVIANLELSIWAQLASDVYTGEDTGFAVRASVRGLLQRSMRSRIHIAAFEEAVLGRSPAIREAIETGERSFLEFSKLFERGYRFRDWLDGLPFDTNLVAEYVREVTAEHWTSKLPAKTVRWSLFTGAGIVADALGAAGLGTAVGLGLGAFDTFVVDKLIVPWRPNQFIEADAKRFLDAK